MEVIRSCGYNGHTDVELVGFMIDVEEAAAIADLIDKIEGLGVNFDNPLGGIRRIIEEATGI